MSDERLGGLALIAGAAGFIVTMVLHPTGHDLVEPGEFEHARALAVVVHALAIACLPVTFAGALVLTRRLAASRLAVLALVVHGVALFGALVAAAINGIAVPNAVKEFLEAEGAAREAWDVALHHAHFVSEAFAGVYVVASCAAIVAWSTAMLRARARWRAGSPSTASCSGPSSWSRSRRGTCGSTCTASARSCSRRRRGT
jgi:hypothetical protein